ncbi:MAG: hypothetical protein DWH76_01140 [Planctomycetota bacterium]|nr:MAG: hypothetical protein DWH76_01140 [Planctomycetota bacterium]
MIETNIKAGAGEDAGKNAGKDASAKIQLENMRVDCAHSAAFEDGLQAACSFRGDVTLELKDGSAVEGYVFDLKRTNASPHAVRILPKDGRARMTVEQSTIQTLCFTGKDAAAGKTWENWMRRYAQMKLQGEVAGIESETLE